MKLNKKAMEMKTLIMWIAALALGAVLLAFLAIRILPAVKTRIFP